jgi:hypothetical protein
VQVSPNVAARHICRAPFSQHIAASSLIAEGVQELCADQPTTALLLSDPQRAPPEPLNKSSVFHFTTCGSMPTQQHR